MYVCMCVCTYVCMYGRVHLIDGSVMTIKSTLLNQDETPFGNTVKTRFVSDTPEIELCCLNQLWGQLLHFLLP